MLEKPDIPDDSILESLRVEYNLDATRVSFLPIGADINSAVYRVMTRDGSAFFLKLRKVDFDPTSVELPKFLSDQGIAQIIPPIAMPTGQLWGSLGVFKTILYPLIDGRDGYNTDLTGEHWQQLGAALKKIHASRIPERLLNCIRKETYSAAGRETVKMFLARVQNKVFDDPISNELTIFLNTKRAEILKLVGRTEQYAGALSTQRLETVVCHSDIHAGNILIGVDRSLYIVDWDEPILAPKERDLMYIGGGLLDSGLTPQEEEALFYRSYVRVQIHAVALAYYRYERIIQDLAAYCEQIFLTNHGREDREEALYYLKSNFFPNSTIEIAYQSDPKKTKG